jgi:glycosyltransferase involved in cell wall biosynthesis
VFGSSYVDTTRFRVTRPVEARENLIGCLGRLSRAKGALNLVKAMPKILRARSDVRLLVAGEGPEQATIAHAIQELGLQDHIDLVGLIPHSELPDLLNGLKLLVLPSYTEGIPAIMLEGMACGTPVVATPVGGIPDYVRDAETGFLISDQTPEGIAESVLKALTHPGLADVARKARGLVEERRSLAAGISEGQAFLSRVLARSLGGVHA